MNDQQLVQLRDELDIHLEPQLWGSQIQAAPECVIQMALCKLVASSPLAENLELSGHGLKCKTLRGNIVEYIQIGRNTLETTATRMRRVGELSNAMSKPGGIIERLLKYIDMELSPMRDNRIRSCITRGVDSIGESVATILGVKQDFTSWKEATTNLLLALVDKSVLNKNQEEKTKSELRKQASEKEGLEKELEKVRKDLKDLETATFFSKIRVLLFALVIKKYRHPNLVSSRQDKESEIASLEKQTRQLNHILKQLSGEEESIAEVARMVRESLEPLNKLLEQINIFMQFLISIQEKLLIINDGKDDVFMEELSAEDLRQLKYDKEIRLELQNHALLMKVRFAIASKATLLYNEVSEQFVMPGVGWVAGPKLTDIEKDKVADKAEEIEEWKNKICKGAKQFIDKRVEELGKELQNLNEESLKAFEEAAPELFEKMMGEARELFDEESQKL